MGVTFNKMHLDLVAAIKDVKGSDGTQITAATDDGKKRSSAQRSRDLMSGRYWAWSIFRLANKRIFHATQPLTLVGAGGIGYADITALNVTSPEDLTLEERSVKYGQPVAVVAGDELPFYVQALKTYKTKDVVAGLVNDNTGPSQKMRLKILLGDALADKDTANYTFELGYYAFPILEELTAASANDVTEPRPWWDALQKYAEYMALKGSADNQIALIALDQAKNLALITIENEFGQEAASRVRQYMGAGGGA